jgi:hypothetical protein
MSELPFAPWQQRAYEQTVAALDAGRLGHGLLICGPDGLGKRAVALKLAAHVLGQGEPAANLRSAQLIAALDGSIIDRVADGLGAVRDGGGRLFILGVGGSAGSLERLK